MGLGGSGHFTQTNLRLKSAKKSVVKPFKRTVKPLKWSQNLPIQLYLTKTLGKQSRSLFLETLIATLSIPVHLSLSFYYYHHYITKGCFVSLLECNIPCSCWKVQNQDVKEENQKQLANRHSRIELFTTFNLYVSLNCNIAFSFCQILITTQL